MFKKAMSNYMFWKKTSFNISSLNYLLNNIEPQVLKPFGNSLLMIAAMTYAKNQADISTMASLEVGL